jgi:RNA polymerase sigma factor (sigma-70 family)
VKNFDDSLNELMDSVHETDFGAHLFNDETQDLKTWTAQDFSSIYVRFHPHVLRHAKRYLSNTAQAEEIVQDAFLYLMTSLPEVDSEVGVLKLLKWKARLLALDVIKSDGRVSYAAVDENDLVEETDLSESLVRADDAAIVSMALAKLSPRQREVIISSVYQEKATSEVASQMGLSENATRQLLLRAKSAFKTALVGEAETAGMSAAQILSVAARKAAGNSVKYLSAASALLVVLAITIGLIPNAPTVTQDAPLAIPLSDGSTPQAQSEQPSESQIQLTDEEPFIDALPVAADSATATEDTASVEVVEAATVKSTAVSVSQELARESQMAPELTLNLSSIIGSIGSTQAGFAYGFGADREQITRELWVFNANGIAAKVDIVRLGDSFEYTLSNLRPTLELADEAPSIRVGSKAPSSAVSESGRTLTLVATDLLLVDESGTEFLQQPFVDSSITVSVQLDLNGQVTAASLFLG